MNNSELLLQLAEKVRQINNNYSNPRTLISFTSVPDVDDYWYEVFENTIRLLEQDIAEIEAALSLCKKVQFDKEELSLSLIKVRKRTKNFLPLIKRQRDYKPKDYLLKKYPEDLGIDVARDIISNMLHQNFGDNEFTVCLKNLAAYANELEAASLISLPETATNQSGAVDKPKTFYSIYPLQNGFKIEIYESENRFRHYKNDTSFIEKEPLNIDQTKTICFFVGFWDDSCKVLKEFLIQHNLAEKSECDGFTWSDIITKLYCFGIKQQIPQDVILSYPKMTYQEYIATAKKSAIETPRKIYEGDIAWEKFYEKLLEYFRPTIPNQPFANKLVKLTDKNIPPSNGYRELLTDTERQLLKTVIPELTDAGLEAVLRDIFNMGDERIKALTWREIFIFCKHYVSKTKNISGNNELCENILGSTACEIDKSKESRKKNMPSTSPNSLKQWCNIIHGGIETMPLEYATYQQPDKPFLPKYPFKRLGYNMFGNGYSIKEGTICNTNPSIIERHRLLMPSEFDIIQRAIKPKVKNDFITITEVKIFLQREFSITDIESVSWPEIVQYCVDYLNNIKQLPRINSGDNSKDERLPKRIISWIFKKTSHIVYVIIAFAFATGAGAVLLEIFTDFGWLHSIKVFIYRILQLK